MSCYYCSYGDYMLRAEQASGVMTLSCGGKTLVTELTLVCGEEKAALTPYERIAGDDYAGISLQEGKVSIRISRQGFTVKGCVRLRGVTAFDAGVFAMSSQGHDFFRSGLGGACTALDDMLFDRETDTALVLEGVKGRCFVYDREQDHYCIDAAVDGEVTIGWRKDVYRSRYGIDYAPINKNATYSRPPAGWMTWYAVKFDAGEQTVMDNARFMAEHLGRFGADTIWVDWEWYHKDMSGQRDDGCDSFHPDVEKYPHGLKSLSDGIRALGLSPALWVGFTVDPGKNEFIRDNPDTILVTKPAWCGQYFFDFSHPKYLQEFLPRAMRQVDEWGFDAVKYDTLPMSIMMHDEYHQNMYDPTLTTKQAYRNMVAKAREVLGKDRYLLSCCGTNDADVLWGCDMFDAARIGGDIFKWEDFIGQAVEKAARYYPFHNIVLYNDPDNVVLREEFNDLRQAWSRAVFVAMLGLPVTIGDDLPSLGEDRLEILRRCIPVMDIHPMDLEATAAGEIVTAVLTVEGALPCTVVSVLNTTDRTREVSLSAQKLGIDAEDVLVYSFFDGTLTNTNVTLAPYETKVLTFCERQNVPQIISTSRHITQGACELVQVQDENGKLTFTAELVAQDPYTVTVHLPEGIRLTDHEGLALVREGDLCRLSVTAQENERYTFSVGYESTH